MEPLGPSPWPLVGRDDELALALGAVATGAGVVLTGAPGVGKTRLAREVLARAVQTNRDARTEWVAATEAAASVPLAAVARLVPAGAIGRGRDATLRAVVGALGDAASAPQRLLVGIDDAHLLDDASATLVHLLLTSGAASAVITVRQGERPPDAIVRLWEDGTVPLVAVQPLARSETEQLVASALDGEVDARLLRFLVDESQGNALFLHELVRDGIQSGALHADDGTWRWHGSFAPGQQLRDVVALRMGRLDDAERDGLEVIAVGAPLDLACVRRLVPDDAIARLERRGVIACSADTREVSVGHPLFGEVVRASIPLARLDEIRRALADAVEATARPTPQVAIRIALWRVDSGAVAGQSELVAAARHAWVIGAAGVAERLARAALETGPDLEAGYLLGEALSDQGRAEEAMAAWQAVEELPGPDQLLASIARGQAGVLAYQLNRPADATVVFRRVLDRITDEGVRQGMLGTVAVLSVVHPAGARLDDEAAAATSADAPLTPALAVARSTASLGSGRFDEALATIDRVLATAVDWIDQEPTMAVLLGMVRVWALALRGDAPRAFDDANRGYEACLVQGVDQPRARWCLARGMIAIAMGRPRTAVAILSEAASLLQAADIGFLRPTQAHLAMAHALLGDPDAAERAEHARDAAAPTLDGVFGVDAVRAGAWTRAERGELSRAADEALRAAALAREQGQSGYEALALHDAARFGRAPQVADRLARVANAADGELIALFAAHARGLADEDGPALDAASTGFAAIGFDLFGAEASAAAARAHRREGRGASALASRQRAGGLVARCEGARTPLLKALDEPSELTEREREIAELAARRLSSREIAARLDISSRTVDNLLGRVYTKLGVSGREELAASLRPRE